MKSKIIKCKTNNQQNQLSSYNILTQNGSSSTTIRSIDVPNEHASIKLHIRRVCSPSSSTETLSIHPTTNLLSQPQQSNELNDQSATKKFLNPNPETNNISRRIITTRRTSLVESDLSHITSSVYDLSKPTINNHNSIYDENTLKKQTTKTNGFKRKFQNEQQEKKRQKLTTKTIKQSTNNTSTLKSHKDTEVFHSKEGHRLLDSKIFPFFCIKINSTVSSG